LAGQKNVLIKNAGLGMIAKGGSDLAASFIPGMGSLDDIFMSLPADQSVLSLPADQSIISAPEIIEGTDNGIGEEYLGEEYLGEEAMAEALEMAGFTEEQ
jgi:hypothetical protein